MAFTRQAMWPMTYAADRRKHRHRCACGCNTIVQPGASVLMARVGDKKTRVMIDAPDHAGKVCDGYTMGDRLEAWGMEHLAACGDPAAKAWRDAAPICRARAGQ